MNLKKKYCHKKQGQDILMLIRLWPTDLLVTKSLIEFLHVVHDISYTLDLLVPSILFTSHIF